MDTLKRELLKSITFEYLVFLRNFSMYTENERVKRISSLENLKHSMKQTAHEDELIDALVWTISNYITTLQKESVTSVPHMLSLTNRLLERDEDWCTRYRHFYEKNN